MEADLVIGAVLVAGAAAPKLVTREMVARMRPGTVLVDVAIDQGGCFEDLPPHDPCGKPTFVRRRGGANYCGRQHAGGGGRATSRPFALGNATLPFILKLADRGVRRRSTRTTTWRPRQRPPGPGSPNCATVAEVARQAPSTPAGRRRWACRLGKNSLLLIGVFVPLFSPKKRERRGGPWPIGKSELQYIRDFGVGLRRAGTEAKNAAYALGATSGFHSPSGPDRSVRRCSTRCAGSSIRRANVELLTPVARRTSNNPISRCGDNEGRFNLVLLTGAPRGRRRRYGLKERRQPVSERRRQDVSAKSAGVWTKESVVDASREFEADDIGSAVDWVIGTLADLAFMA